MKISIMSDLHFGYAKTFEMEEDSFENAKEAIEKSLDCDIILIAGDIFDSRTPSIETWSKALEVLTSPLLTEDKEVKLVKVLNKNIKEISDKTLNRTPIIALHGTHERRGKDQINSIQALEQAGFLIHLHCNGIILEKDMNKVAIQGMSGVPERYAKDILEKWDPKPIEGCYNILMLHQSIEPYIYSPLDPPTLSLNNLPEGFDLIINGHIHNHQKTKIGKTEFIIPGSTIVTQLKEEDIKTPRVFYKLEIPKSKITLTELENARKLFYIELPADCTKQRIEEEIEKVIKGNNKKKPLIKIKLTGKGKIIDKELRNLEKKYRNECILKFQKKLESEEVEKKLEMLEKMREEKLSIEEMGLKLLKENLTRLNFSNEFDSESLFRILSAGEVETAFNILTKKQQTLKGWKP